MQPIYEKVLLSPLLVDIFIKHVVYCTHTVGAVGTLTTPVDPVGYLVGSQVNFVDGVACIHGKCPLFYLANQAHSSKSSPTERRFGDMAKIPSRYVRI